jgi:hypothetical protein
MTPVEALRHIQRILRAAPSVMDRQQLSLFLFALRELTIEGLGDRGRGAPNGRVTGVIRPLRSVRPHVSAKMAHRGSPNHGEEAKQNGHSAC